MLAASLSGCASLRYYSQLASGQYEVLSKRESIAAIIDDPKRDTELRRRLAQVRDARRYAVEHLLLPDNRSYTQYSDLRRPYVVWNVLATPEFSLDPVQSCFPLVGCLAYRGYYHEAEAREQIAALRAKGYDADIGGVPAYSTLGWFDDPVLNTMMRWSDAALIGTLFHELAHQKLYVKDDTRFNESFASFVEQEGLRQYLEAQGLDDAQAEAERKQERQFVSLVLAFRGRLLALYKEPLESSEMRTRKQAAFESLRADYAELRDRQWNGDARYDGWFARPLNNALLVPFGLYDEWVPAFTALYERSGREWPAFYAAAKRLSKLAAAARTSEIESLLARPATAQ